MVLICPTCTEEYQHIGIHWSKSSTCDYPEIPPQTKSISTGLLMGDGHIERWDSGSARLTVTSKSDIFLQHLSDDVFEWLSKDPFVYRTATDAAESLAELNDAPAKDPETYSDYYRINTVTHPFFATLDDQLTDKNKKTFPEDLSLDESMLKYWYASDGTLEQLSKNSYRIILYSSTQDLQKCCNIVETLGVDAYVKKPNSIATSTTDTKELLDRIGPPVPGYEYKWDV